ncbi:MAG: endolytic transglycosylase MltG [Candidatus Aminicenantes bacterium]|nr:endolytic transglycosylase MltG [Candidatus Aminicenantes bacterium]
MILKAVKIFLFSAVIGLLFFTSWFTVEWKIPYSSQSEPDFFSVPSGSSVERITRDLQKAGILKKRWPFSIGYKFFYHPNTLKAGEYSLSPSFSPKDVLHALAMGKVYVRPMTIPEGLTRQETASLLEEEYGITAERFVKITSCPDLMKDWDPQAESLEGYLFPETYHFPRTVKAETVVEAMVAQFREVFSDTWKKRAGEMEKTPREIVILASLVEKETAVPEERALISSVFHNRLNRGMKLDCDPTIIYALKEEERYTGRLRYRDLKWDSPYNTYVHAGLPPGPICNPGRGSLQAALFPEKTNYLYFVSKNDGSHYFSRTLKEHQRAVFKYQINRKNP